MDTKTSSLPSSGTPNASAEPVTSTEPVVDAPKSSEQHAEKGGEKGQETTSKKKGSTAARERCNPTTLLKKAAAAVALGVGNTDPSIISACARVEANAALMPTGASAADTAVDAAHTAKAVWEQTETSLKLSAAALFALLRTTAAGRKLVATGMDLPSLTRAVTYVIAGLPGAALSMPEALMSPLTAAMATSVSAKKAYDDAEKARSDASAKYTALKVQLKASISVLSAGLKLDAANQRAKEREVSTVPTPEPAAPIESPPVAVVNGKHAPADEANGSVT